jgi:hypothetical protein
MRAPCICWMELPAGALLALVMFLEARHVCILAAASTGLWAALSDDLIWLVLARLTLRPRLYTLKTSPCALQITVHSLRRYAISIASEYFTLWVLFPLRSRLIPSSVSVCRMAVALRGGRGCDR